VAALKQTAFKLTKEDLALLDAAREHAGVLSRAEAFRYLLRYWARAEGMKVETKRRRAKGGGR